MIRARLFWMLAPCGVFIVAAAAQTPVRDNPGVRTGTAAISGVVVTDEANSKPLRRVTVSLASGELRLPQITVTDDQGRFAFAELVPGNYTLVASRPAYVSAFYGSKKPGRGPGVPIAVLEGQTINNITIRMLHGSSISGALRHASGQPVQGITVQVTPLSIVDGERKVSSTTLAALAALNGGGVTDDRGMYRVFGLAPGDYLVQTQLPPGLNPVNESRLVTPNEVQWAAQAAAASPAPPPGQTVTYATVYYPGTTNIAQASVVSVGPNEDREGIDLQTQLVPTAKITGTLIGTDNQPLQGGQVSLRATGSAAADLLTLIVGAASGGRSGQDGTFSLTGVTPGRYSLVARASTRQPGPGRRGGGAFNMTGMQEQMAVMMGGGGGTQVLWAQEELIVDGHDISNLTLNLQPGMTVAGKFVFESSTLPPPADLTTARVTIAPPPTGTSPLEFAVSILSAFAPSTTAADGTFAVKGLTPGQYKLSVGMPGMIQSPTTPGGGWVLTSVTVGPNGPDISDSVIDLKPGQDLSGLIVTLSDRPTELSGVVKDSAGRPAPGFPIVIFSTDRSTWAMGSRRVLLARPASDGRYRLVGMPAGQYFVAAVTDIEPAQLSDSLFLDQLAGSAFTLTLAPGEKKTQDLRLGG